MKITYRKISIFGILFILILFALYISGVRINTTKSIPIGIYLTTNKQLSIGDFVMFCPPDTDIFLAAKKRGYITSGFCSGDYGYMMKQVVGQTGDMVTITEKGVLLNDQLLPHSQLIESDLDGNALPKYKEEYVISDGDVLLMSNISDTSFDGRYFGPISKNQILTVVNPLITFGGE